MYTVSVTNNFDFHDFFSRAIEMKKSYYYIDGNYVGKGHVVEFTFQLLNFDKTEFTPKQVKNILEILSFYPIQWGYEVETLWITARREL